MEDFEAATIPAGTSALDTAVEQISRAFRVRQDEVAILVLIGEGKILQSLIPEKLEGIGTIPLTSTKALAAPTARKRRPELINKFNWRPHASVFEGVPLGRGHGEQIHRIMSAPIVAEGKVVGWFGFCWWVHSQAYCSDRFLRTGFRLAVFETLNRSGDEGSFPLALTR